MKKISQAEKAKLFLKLHNANNILVLPNIWNPIGARILESKSYPAIATASAAISASLGYQDGEKIKFTTHLDIIQRIAKSVDIPVSADVETGYSSNISELKKSIDQIIDTGVVGINIEDSYAEGRSLRSLDEQCERITTIRETANNKEIHLVINARIDYFLLNPDYPKEDIINEIIKRANVYTKAGADCVYPIGIFELDTIIKLRKGIHSPINILSYDKSESLMTLSKVGINRVSFGPNIFRSCMKKFINIVNELYELGSNECFVKDSITREGISKYLSIEKE